MSRFALVLLVAAATVHCTPQRFRARPLSPEAAAVLSRTSGDVAGALLVDVDGFRELGFDPPSKPGETPLADLLLYLLPAAATEIEDEEGAALAARAAVLVGVMREAVDWPGVLQLGLWVPTMGRRPTPAAALSSVVLVAAVDRDLEGNRELLRSLAAVDRAGGTPLLEARGDDLCLGGKAAAVGLCLRAGPGYVVLSSPSGLAGLQALPAATAALQPGSLLRVRFDVPGLGRGELDATGRAGVDVRAFVESARPREAAKLERLALEGLRKMDERRERMRAALAPQLAATRAAVAADPQAPERVRAAAAGLTVERLLDRTGHYDEVRRSMVVRRDGTRVTFSLSVPEPLVRDAAESGDLMVTVAVVGILAAIAIPNFIKFQCRSKQSEVKANLRAAYTAHGAYVNEREEPPPSFEAMGFSPEPGTRYTYCFAGGCLPCTLAGCEPPKAEENPCLGMIAARAEGGGTGPYFCAVGNVDEDDDAEDLDVWLVESDGTPQNVMNDCD